MFNVETDILQSIFYEVEQKLSYSGSSGNASHNGIFQKIKKIFNTSSSNSLENGSYIEILDEIKVANKEISDQLKIDINHLFMVDNGEYRKITTLLHFAAENNYPQAVKLLLNKAIRN